MSLSEYLMWVKGYCYARLIGSRDPHCREIKEQLANFNTLATVQNNNEPKKSTNPKVDDILLKQRFRSTNFGNIQVKPQLNH